MLNLISPISNPRVIAALKDHKLLVFSSCTGIIDEFGMYSRELDANGQPTDKIKDKATYHRLDALRYAAGVMSEAPAQVFI